MHNLFAYTDGACSGNPGPGGWGVLLVAKNQERIIKERELFGGQKDTTNNQMELLAAISALEALDRPSKIKIIICTHYTLFPPHNLFYFFFIFNLDLNHHTEFL